MTDKILESFLRGQLDDGTRLARQSDILKLVPEGGELPTRYIAEFRCRALTRGHNGDVAESNGCAVMIWFAPDYLRRADVVEVVTLLRPVDLYHPNVRFPFVCLGRLGPGTPLVDILYQVFEIVTYQKATMREEDALNREACQWARNHQERFPLERRPFKRRILRLECEEEHRP